jgi:hypothetical protein
VVVDQSTRPFHFKLDPRREQWRKSFPEDVRKQIRDEWLSSRENSGEKTSLLDYVYMSCCCPQTRVHLRGERGESTAFPPFDSIKIDGDERFVASPLVSTDKGDQSSLHQQ